MSTATFGQSQNQINDFHGAKAELDSYHVLYALHHSDEKSIKGIIRNINNSLDDPRLKGKLQVELVAFGDGVEIFKKTNNYKDQLLALQKRGVILTQCENTIKERKIEKAELWSFINFVPSANGEIIIRQTQGWAFIMP